MVRGGIAKTRAAAIMNRARLVFARMQRWQRVLDGAVCEQTGKSGGGIGLMGRGIGGIHVPSMPEKFSDNGAAERCTDVG